MSSSEMDLKNKVNGNVTLVPVKTSGTGVGGVTGVASVLPQQQSSSSSPPSQIFGTLGTRTENQGSALILSPINTASNAQAISTKAIVSSPPPVGIAKAETVSVPVVIPSPNTSIIPHQSQQNPTPSTTAILKSLPQSPQNVVGGTTINITDAVKCEIKSEESFDSTDSDSDIEKGSLGTISMPVTLNVPAPPVTMTGNKEQVSSGAAAAIPAAIPALPPGTIAKPVVDARLEVALEGNEPTVRNLIMAAIGVMKNRKARPDGKRISNWIHRRYGRPMVSINEELEKMVNAGELSRVDYKGSASYRITTPEAKSARKRRRMEKSALHRSNSLLRQQQSSSSSVPPQAVMDQINRPPPFQFGAAGSSTLIKQTETSLRTIVLDFIGDTALKEGTTLTTNLISKAIEASRRPINKNAILGNLPMFLEKEVNNKNFIRTGDDTYVIPRQTVFTNGCGPPTKPPPITTSQLLMPPPPPRQLSMINSPIPNLSSLTPPPPPTCSKTILTPSPSSVFPSILTSKSSPLASATPPLPNYTKMTFINNVPTTSSQPSTPVTIGGPVKSEEEKKNDLIQEKLSKLSKQNEKSPNKKVSSNKITTPPSSVDQIPMYKLMREKRINRKNRNEVIMTNKATEVSQKPKVGRPRKIKKGKKENKKRKIEVESEDEDTGNEDIDNDDDDDDDDYETDKWKNNSNTGGSNQRSSRKKKSRKIFDPADHDNPPRKKLASSFKNKESCSICESGEDKNKMGNFEKFLVCKECSATVHPSCLDYNQEMTKIIMASSSWECINCKTCGICNSNNNDNQMVFCDICDSIYHVNCHQPKHQGKQTFFQCYKCKSSISNSSEGELSSPDLVSRFIPVLPIDTLKNEQTSWEDYPIDLNIPDVNGWNAKSVKDYFVANGFSREHAQIFMNQEIDGKSLLMLHRSDVTAGLGLKLGPALKIYSLVRKLQTRRHLPNC